ncbi:class I SAM-dependent methyltransferase [Bosea eneae]|uniref:Class I SAM-dependent methyltransferase n=1 Tax=Bosea eneae TaxID=151454 RepID=A0ABW0IKP7_9HYPH
MSWRDFWNGEHAIYVSDRHKALHYRRIAQDIAAAVPSKNAVVLDVGCGEAFLADLVAGVAGRLILCEAAPAVRDRLEARFGEIANLSVLSPEEVEVLPGDSLDLVVANSLIQYLSEDELRRALATWRAKLKPGGELILADVIPPDLSPLTDAIELLGFAWRGGFFIAALGGLVRTVFSDYRKLRAQYGLSTYSAAGITALVEAAGFKGVTRRTNFGHNPRRMAFSARKPLAAETPVP